MLPDMYAHPIAPEDTLDLGGSFYYYFSYIRTYIFNKHLKKF